MRSRTDDGFRVCSQPMHTSPSISLPSSPATPLDCRRADQAVSEAMLITSSSQLEAWAERLTEAPALGLDTEFVRERTFYPRPGLVQVSDGDSVALLDAVALPQMTGLGRLLDEQSRTKVLHSVGEDLEVLNLLTSTLPRPLFDTQIAAAMLGFPLQCRYENLVAEVLGVELPGGKARSDWCKRPLTRDLTRYGAQDVIWLPRLHATLAEALETRGRLSWLEEDCTRLLAAAAADAAEPPVARVKGAGNLGDEQLEILSRLADWRDREAKRRDLPRSFVLRDDMMLALANSTPGTERERRVHALPPPVIRRYAEALLDTLNASPNAGFERPLAFRALSPEQRAHIKSCQSAVSRVAEEIQVEPALLASRRDITRVVRGEASDRLDGWRAQFLRDILAT